MAENNSDDEKAILSAIHEHMDEILRQSHPDHSIVVYCDRHLGVRMRLARSWTIGPSYGEAAADVNPLDFWRCTKPGCERCYEPRMFGYFRYASEMGSRIESNPEKQPRCNHQELPFMYIGRCGQGRQYLCPFYKCTEKGEIVAVEVVDEAVSIPQDSLEGLNNRDRQRINEMTTFTSFGSASGLEIDPGSPTNGDQGYPDIRCTILGNLYWFELGQIIHPDVAENINPKRRKQSSGFSFDQELPFVDIVSKKATKKYDTQGAPVDLILHFDLQLGTTNVVLRQIDKHSHRLESLLNDGPFARIWILDEWRKTIVWSKAKSAV